MPIGTTAFISSINIKAPKTLPNKRMHNESGLIKISIIFSGTSKGKGSAKDFKNPLTPF